MAFHGYATDVCYVIIGVSKIIGKIIKIRVRDELNIYFSLHRKPILKTNGSRLLTNSRFRKKRERETDRGKKTSPFTFHGGKYKSIHAP